mmetsp:Transcript_13146/g.24231  ORF Transcript_13146/g.24231 Transcript_13146/m.24231 type:complete len:914 (-) Transcript_13146:51-2792(-)
MTAVAQATLLSCLLANLLLPATALVKEPPYARAFDRRPVGQESYQSPAVLTAMWDPQTLASFSLSQLSAFARLASGWCPLLSRTISCETRGGRLAASGSSGRIDTSEALKKLIGDYLDEEASLAKRQVLGMMRHVWYNYEMYAFGKDELMPVTGVGKDTWGGMGMTLVDSLDTLWLLGFAPEFKRAVAWVEEHLSFDIDLNVNFFETSIRQLGGLLGAYSLSRRPKLLEKAVDLAQRLLKTFARPLSELNATKGGRGMLSKLLDKLGLREDQVDRLDSAWEMVQAEQRKSGILPRSDVNLQSGHAQNMAGFVSLAEAYVPVEYKALALFTRNCSYAVSMDGVLKVVNKTQSLAERGIAPIMLSSEGQTFPSPENRLSMGSRGDSFYEYLLKDWVFSGLADDVPARPLWLTFLNILPALFVDAGVESSLRPAPQQGSTNASNTSGNGSSNASSNASKQVKRRSWRLAWNVRRQQGLDAGIANGSWYHEFLKRKEQDDKTRGAFARSGGWYESAKDVSVPWTFLREVGFSKSFPKMDHLNCFLPGAIALDVLHRQADPGASAQDNTTDDGLHVAHKLLETCAHMYFRTVTDMAPEITRFNAYGMHDDKGSMHNILRPETLESLTLMWQTTKSQVYRNWGQRILAAFARQRTDFAYASLDNVNKPYSFRDSMPSFFLAESIKYLFLIFAPEDVLPWKHMVLNTEAHLLPMATAEIAWWPCRELPSTQQPLFRSKQRDRRLRRKSKRRKRDAQTSEKPFKVVVDNRKGSLGIRLTRIKGQPSYVVANITAGGAISTWNSFFQDREVKVGDFVLSVNGIQGSALLHEARRRQWLVLSVKHGDPHADPAPRLRSVPAVPLSFSKRRLAVDAEVVYLHEAQKDDQSCWKGGFSYELCCQPPPTGNPLCWDVFYTYERCCT